MESAPKEADIPVDGSVESIIFQEKLDDCLTMIDYFFLIGVSEDIVLDTLRKSNYDLKEAKALLDLKEPSILSRFPYHDKKDMPIDRTQLLELPKTAFPGGFKTELAKHGPKFRHLSAQYNLGLTIYYIHSFIFYEEAKDFTTSFNQQQTHLEEMQKLLQKQMTDDMARIHGDSNQRSTDISNFANRQSESRGGTIFDQAALDDINEYENNKEDVADQQMSQHFQKASSSDPNMIRREQSNIIQQSSMKDRLTQPLTPGLIKSNLNLQNDLNSDRLFIPKVFCIISKMPFFDYYIEILEDLYKASKDYLKSSLESYIYNLVVRLPPPPRGLTTLDYQLLFKPDRSIKIRQPNLNELPYSNVSFFNTLFQSVKIQDIIYVFSMMLLEKNILIVSDSYESLYHVCFAFHQLIHPFELATIVPLLSASQLEYLCCPQNFFFGIHESILEEAINELQSESMKEVVILQLKTGELLRTKVSYEIYQNNQVRVPIANNEQVKLPRQLKHDLIKDINSQIKATIDSQNPLNEKEVNFIRNQFYNTLALLFAEYKPKTIEGPHYIQFDVKGFLGQSKPEYKEFLNEFFQRQQKTNMNQMFQYFLEKTKLSKHRAGKFDIKHFDDTIINLKKQRGGLIGLPFNGNDRTESRAQTIDEEQLSETKVPQPISQLLSDENYKQIYIENESETYPIQKVRIQSGLEYGIRYSIIPNFHTEIFNSEYKTGVFGTDNFDNKNNRVAEQITKISLNPHNKKERTYIFLAYFYMWCGVLWQQNQNEKIFRLKQILYIIRQMAREQMVKEMADIFHKLLNVTHTYGDDFKMVKDIWEKIKLLNVNVNIIYRSLFDFYQNRNQRDDEEEEKKSPAGVREPTFHMNGSDPIHQLELKHKEFDYDRYLMDPLSKGYTAERIQNRFKKRTFKLKEDSNIALDEVKIKLQEHCHQCNQDLLAQQLRQAFDHLKSQTQDREIMAHCSFCGNEIHSPELTVYLGHRSKNKTDKVIPVPFMSASMILSTVEQLFISSQMKIDILSIRKFNQPLFWNLIYYFCEQDIAYDFMLPYEHMTDEDTQIDSMGAHKINPVKYKVDVVDEMSDEDLFDDLPAND